MLNDGYFDNLIFKCLFGSATSEEKHLAWEEIGKRQDKLKEYEKQLDLDYVNNNYVSKDKIRNVVKGLEEMNVDGEAFGTAKNFAIIEIKKEILGE